MSPVVALRRSAQCGISSGQSLSRWWGEIRSVLYGYGSTGMLGSGSEGDQLQKTLHIAYVLVRSTLWRWLGNLNECLESGSSVFHCRRSSTGA